MSAPRGWAVVAAVAAALAAAPTADAGKRRHRVVDRSAELRAAIAAGVPATLGVVDVEAPAAVRQARGEIVVRWPRAARARWLSVEVDVGAGRAATTGWVQVELGTLRAVVVATRDLAAGERLDAADVAIEARPVDGLQVVPAALAGRKVLTAVRRGEPVTADAVELPPPVARGTEVDVVVERGGVTIAARGTLEADARVGAEVAVRVTATRRVLRSRLADDAATVRVAGGGA
ncbi:MAG: flagellar basal body P-ring formation protein FlgA [Kofleriaceae bacterium]|nr:flagellar basal body P-ring formation protein FlgA [Kofleriaceae bacterium]